MTMTIHRKRSKCVEEHLITPFTKLKSTARLLWTRGNQLKITHWLPNVFEKWN